ncbi:MAG: hypothetical protein M1834_003393 [Cirrosporium novae-zelandiae]|nr:MAG: hypothetical protein M1834_003393 [Cirrosporium novae-zelandiae]
MFRRLSNTLPKDPLFPSNLEALGLFVNDKDQIRQIKNPEQEYPYRISKNDRVNEMHKEAIHIWIRKNILGRLQDLGLEILRLPLGASTTEPHVPVLVSQDLSTKKRVLVYIGDRSNELGVIAYRIIGHEGIAKGSLIDIVKLARSINPDNEEHSLGFIIANPGQLVWHRRESQTLSFATWECLPKKSAVEVPIQMDSTKNCIPDNENSQKHVASIFNHVIKNHVNPNAKLDIIGVCEGAMDIVQFLNRNWSVWGSCTSAIALSEPYHDFEYLTDPNFRNFLAQHCRAYFAGEGGLDEEAPESSRFGCKCYYSGEGYILECIFPKAARSILSFFKESAGHSDSSKVGHSVNTCERQAGEQEPCEKSLSKGLKEGNSHSLPGPYVPYKKDTSILRIATVATSNEVSVADAFEYLL